MIPRIAKGGRSFRGAFDYYMHDKGAQTSDRVAWTQTENMLTDNPQLAWKVMAFTAQAQERLKQASGQSRAGRKLENPVFSFSLSWHPEQEPDQEHMLDTAHKALEMMGMSEHESVIVAHNDEPHKHVHVIVNRVHPISGIAADVRHSKRKFSDFAREYEREHGKIYCKQREENHQKRQNGEKTRYHDPIIAEAWNQTTDGRGFIDALSAKNYILAHGRKRLVVIDPHGKSVNPVRHLEGVKTKDLNQRLQDIDITLLPTVDKVLQQRKAQSNVPDTPRIAFEKAAEVASEQQKSRRKAEKEEASRLIFEKLASMKIQAMKDQQKADASSLKHRYRQHIKSAKMQLAGLYDLPSQKKRIQELVKLTRKQSWWKKLTGKAKKERQTLYEALQNYQSGYRRYLEKLDSIKNEYRVDHTTMRERHRSERAELKVYLKAQRKAGNFTLQSDDLLRRDRKKQNRKQQENSQRIR